MNWSMRGGDDETTILISIECRLWLTVDGTLDNSVAIAAVDGDEETVERGRRVRHAGWAAMRSAPETNAIGWPPPEYSLPVRASRSDWRFVIAQLARWEAVPGDTGDPDARRIIDAALGQ